MNRFNTSIAIDKRQAPLANVWGKGNTTLRKLSADHSGMFGSSSFHLHKLSTCRPRLRATLSNDLLPMSNYRWKLVKGSYIRPPWSLHASQSTTIPGPLLHLLLHSVPQTSITNLSPELLSTIFNFVHHSTTQIQPEKDIIPPWIAPKALNNPSRLLSIQ